MLKGKLPGWAGAVAVGLCEILVGILLLIDPEGFTCGIIICAGIVLTVVGLVASIGYFRTAAAEASQQQRLAKGLCLMGIGLFCTFHSEWFLVTFSALSMLYGVAILLLGFMRLQWMVDDMRLKTGKWKWSAACAALTLLIAVIILCNPFAAARAIWYFVGISLIVEAVLDITALVMISRAVKAITQD